MERDFVDGTLALWQREWPELATEPAAVLDRLLRVSQMLTKELDAVCREFGVGLWGFAVLTALRRAGPPYQLSPTQLYRSGMVTSGAMTRRLRELAALDLVERVPSEDDGRSVEVRLTERGCELVEALLPEYLAAEGRFLDLFDDGERGALVALLRRLLIRLEGERMPDAAESTVGQVR